MPPPVNTCVSSCLFTVQQFLFHTLLHTPLPSPAQVCVPWDRDPLAGASLPLGNASPPSGPEARSSRAQPKPSPAQCPVGWEAGGGRRARLALRPQ